MDLTKLKGFKKGAEDYVSNPIGQLEVARWSGFGGMIGLIIALAAMIYVLIVQWDWRTFGFGLLVFFMIPMQYTQYINAGKKIAEIKEMQERQQKMMKEMIS